jgi:SAM-dependent methyltransferase
MNPSSVQGAKNSRLRNNGLTTTPSAAATTTTPSFSQKRSQHHDTTTTTPVTSMRERFQNKSLSNHHAVWESLWKDQTTPWDLKQPTPVLQKELESFYRPRVKAFNKKTVLRTLVPGCGAGYDLITLANFHDDLIAANLIQGACVVGLDVSETSLQLAAQQIEAAWEFCPLDRPTRIKLVKGDFFDTNSWEILYSYGGDVTSMQDNKPIPKFDLIYDYTFMSALHPSLRAKWGETICNLSGSDTGCLLTLMFPLMKAPVELKGPPFAVQLDSYRQVLEPFGMLIESDYPRESPYTIARRVGQEQVCWWSRRTNHNLSTMAKL